MSISNGYATLAEFKLYAVIDSTDTNDDSVIEDNIEAASRLIDRITNRTFYARTETRYYSIPEDGGRQLDVDDDLLTITTLTNGDGNEIAATEYNLIPKNLTPYRAIRLKASSSTYWTFDSDGNSEYVISVAGTWGWSATAPHDIREACLKIAQSLYKGRSGETTSSTSIVTAAGVVKVPQEMSSLAREIARNYNRWL